MKMYPMQQKVFNEFRYCITCEKMVRLTSGGIHLIPGYYRGVAVCDGPFTSCPPPEEGGFLLASDADFEQEEPEPTYEDIHFMQNVEVLLHAIDEI